MKYETKDIEINIDGKDEIRTISTEECEKELFTEDGDYTSDEAKKFDESIFFYVPEKVFYSTDTKIREYILKNIS